MGLVPIKTRNASISTVKFRQKEYKTGFLSSTLWNIRCSLNPKAQAANKAQQQLRPEPYFPEFLKSRAQASLKFLLISLYLCMNYKGKDTCVTRGVCRNLSRGLIIYLFLRGTHHSVGPEHGNNFTDPRGVILKSLSPPCTVHNYLTAPYINQPCKIYIYHHSFSGLHLCKISLYSLFFVPS